MVGHGKGNTDEAKGAGEDGVMSDVDRSDPAEKDDRDDQSGIKTED